MIPSSFAHRLKTLAAISSIMILALFFLGAGPRQGGVPPQPYGANFFSGVITVQGQTPPAGTQIVGCVGGCVEVFQSDSKPTDADGNYIALQLNPDDEELVGRVVTFYLVNEYGRIIANETRRFEGDFNIYDLNLTFSDPIPVFKPAPTAMPAVPPSLNLIPDTGLATAVSGVGFASDSLITLTSGETTLGTALTDGTGAFYLVIAAPSSVAGGYEITSTDAEGTFRSATLTVPDLTGPGGVTGARGQTGTGGVDGNQGSAGPTGSDASLVLPVVALVLAGLGILTIIVIYLYLISWYKELARRLPPPGIR